MTRLQKYKEFFIMHFENLHNGMSFNQGSEEIRQFIKSNDGSLDAIVANPSLFKSYH